MSLIFYVITHERKNKSKTRTTTLHYVVVSTSELASTLENLPKLD